MATQINLMQVIAELTVQVFSLQAENNALKKELERKKEPKADVPGES